MKHNYTDIAIILDRSGSMRPVQDDTIGGFNSFLDDQQKLTSETTISLYQFDDRYDIVYEGKPIQDAPKLTNETFVPRGWTALYDAIGKTINMLGEKYSGMKEEERPEKVLVVIITDGEENRSEKFKFDEIKEMINHQQNKYNWKFAFIGSELKAVGNAKSLGIVDTMNYENSANGNKRMYKTLSACVANARSVDASDYASMNFFDNGDNNG